MELSTSPESDAAWLSRLYKQSHFYKTVFDHFAGRTNNSNETTVDRLHAVIHAEIAEVSRRDIIELFKTLESRGYGEFVVGRKGHPTRFVWRVELIALGKTASGEANAVEPLIEVHRSAPETDDIPIDFIHHIFTLRPDLRIELALPRDLTLVEATRLGDFVRTLPFAR